MTTQSSTHGRYLDGPGYDRIGDAWLRQLEACSHLDLAYAAACHSGDDELAAALLGLMPDAKQRSRILGAFLNHAIRHELVA